MDCCSDDDKGKKGWLQGLIYGLLPHTGCFAFIIGSILGATVLMNFAKPLLMNQYFFHYLIGISLGFATLSAALYLRKHNKLTLSGSKTEWKYLTTLYGSTVVINLLLFMVIFPLLANVSIDSPTGAVIAGDVSMRLKVNIPCPGHAPLVSEELKTLDGIKQIQFSYPNYFDIVYDTSKVSKNEILNLPVFRSFSAREE